MFNTRRLFILDYYNTFGWDRIGIYIFVLVYKTREYVRFNEILG